MFRTAQARNETRGQHHAARVAQDLAREETRAQARAARILRAENAARYARAMLRA